MITQVLFIRLRATEEKQNGFNLTVYCQLKVPPWSASYSACVAYTKTIIHLSVGESGGYLQSREALSPPLR